MAAHVELLILAGLGPKDIAVITPYNGQVDALRQLLGVRYPTLEVSGFTAEGSSPPLSLTPAPPSLTPASPDTDAADRFGPWTAFKARSERQWCSLSCAVTRAVK